MLIHGCEERRRQGGDGVSLSNSDTTTSHRHCVCRHPNRWTDSHRLPLCRRLASFELFFDTTSACRRQTRTRLSAVALWKDLGAPAWFRPACAMPAGLWHVCGRAQRTPYVSRRDPIAERLLRRPAGKAAKHEVSAQHRRVGVTELGTHRQSKLAEFHDCPPYMTSAGHEGRPKVSLLEWMRRCLSVLTHHDVI